MTQLKYVFSFSFFLFSVCLFGQHKYLLNIQTLDKDKDFVKEEIKYKATFLDSLAVISELKKQVLNLHGKTYLEASVDSLQIIDTTFTAFIHIGNKYKWARLQNGNVEDKFLQQIGFSEKLYSNKPFYYEEVKKLQESLLSYAENHGYPFAEVWLDSIIIGEGEIQAQLFMNKKHFILFDGVELRGDVKISNTYLSNYLGLKKGTPFNLDKFEKIKSRLKELPFLKERRSATISFKGDKATVNLFVDKKKASRWDFLFGLLPNSNFDPVNNPSVKRFLFTASLKADLQNQFGLGERLFVEFERLRPETQELNLQFTYPYILDLPFGVDVKFSQYRKDSTYRDIIFDVGLQYLFEGGNYLKAFWNNTSSDLLTIDKESLQFQKTPNRLDVKNSTFGLEYNLQKLDYRFNPRKGWGLFLRAGAGTKRIEKNNVILEVLPTFYDSIQLKSFQYKFTSRLDGYLPFFKRGVIKGSIQGGMILSEQAIFDNEQFRIGGNRLLRGFDEEGIQATNFAVATLEYRFIIDTNSFLYLFGDFAYVEDITPTRRVFDRPLGFGAGISFETRVGVFGLSYALGKRFNNPINFNAAKIHFGYISFF